jgi:Aspartyl protease/PDZ domain
MLRVILKLCGPLFVAAALSSLAPGRGGGAAATRALRPAPSSAQASAQAAAQSAAQSSAQSPAQSARRVARVPFELNGNMIYLQVRVNGSRPLWFALDTGAHSSVVNSTVVQSLALKAEGAGVVTGAGGRVPTQTLRGIAFDISGAQLTGLNLPAIPLAPLEQSTGRAMDGILGSEFFRRYVVEIDYEAEEIALYEPDSFRYAGRGEGLPLSFYDNHPYVRARVELPGRPAIEGEFIIDAGSNLQLILLPSFVEGHGLRGSLPQTLKTYGRGVGGEVVLPVGRVAALHLGPFRVERPVTAFPTAGHFGREGKAGNIGSAVLRRFKVTFDYSRRRMYLEPGGRFAEPFEHDMSGLQFVTEPPAFNVFRVRRVLPGTPAEEAGIRSGDEIVSFDGRPAAEFRLASLRELLRQPGKTYPVRIRRGGDTLSLELKTRRLI